MPKVVVYRRDVTSRGFAIGTTIISAGAIVFGLILDSWALFTDGLQIHLLPGELGGLAMILLGAWGVRFSSKGRTGLEDLATLECDAREVRLTRDTGQSTYLSWEDPQFYLRFIDNTLIPLEAGSAGILVVGRANKSLGWTDAATRAKVLEYAASRSMVIKHDPHRDTYGKYSWNTDWVTVTSPASR